MFITIYAITLDIQTVDISSNVNINKFDGWFVNLYAFLNV